MKIFAEEVKLGTIGGEGLGPFGNIQFNGVTALTAVVDTISSIIGIMTVAASIWFLLQFVIGGFFWITSGGDKTKLHEARERITNAFIGLIIVVAGWAILSLAGQFFGYNILIDPKEVIEQLNIPVPAP